LAVSLLWVAHPLLPLAIVLYAAAVMGLAIGGHGGVSRAPTSEAQAARIGIPTRSAACHLRITLRLSPIL
jgi:hypothetical protein